MHFFKMMKLKIGKRIWDPYDHLLELYGIGHLFIGKVIPATER